MKSRVAGIVLIIGSLYYTLAEAISATFFNDSFVNTYIFHTISELGIPNANSPLFWLMNSAFILIGLALIFASFYNFRQHITKNRIFFYILTLIAGIGVIIVGLVHAGNPLTLSYHSLGAVMAILGGNIMLILVSRSMAEFKSYQLRALILGVFVVVAFLIMFSGISGVYLPVFERLSVYTLILWCFLTGIYLVEV